MRNVLLLIFITVIQVYADETFSQNSKLSLTLKNVTVANVLEEIQNNSEFYFLFNSKLIDVDREVSISMEDKKISEILTYLFSGTGVNFLVYDKQIILTPGDTTTLSAIMKPQQLKISGTVTEMNGEPLVGVNVVVTGTTHGTITDIAGKYSIEIPQGAKSLTFTFIGMEPQEITIGTSGEINVTMAESAIGLEEVVVIGYGTQSKATITGAISVIDNDILENRPSTKTTDLLQGISSGIQITRNNTGNIKTTNDIVIRGVTSRSAPGILVVVDGVAQANTDASALDNINPDDIENISILKDGQAAIYGARAAGGVILITTKSGKTDKPTINFSAVSTIQSPSLKRETINILQLFEMNNEGYINDGQPINAFTGVLKIISDNNFTVDKLKENNHEILVNEPYDHGNPYYLGDYDWQDIMWEPSLQQNYNLSVSGKRNNFNYYESVNYIDQPSMLAHGTNYRRRFLITLKNDYDVTSFLKVKSNFNVGIYKFTEPFGYSGGFYGVEGSSYFVLPCIAPYTTGGHYQNVGGFYSPLGFAKDGGNSTDVSHILHGTLGAEIRPFKDLVITAEIASNFDITETDWAEIGFDMYDALDNYSANSTDGINRAGAEYSRTRYMVGNLYANYSYEKFENHKFNLMAGYSHEENDFRNFSAYRRYGLINGQLPTMIAGSANEQYNSEVKNDFSLNSVYSRLDYSFKNRYLFGGIFRYDGSSKFAEGHKWSPFFGFSGGWVISEESFMANLKNVVDFFKIRASWGQLGNQTGIGLYDYISQVTVGSAYPMGNWNAPSQSQIATLGPMASTTRTWETIESKNLGFDFRALSSKLTGTFDVYIKDNKNMFFNQEFPQVLGTTSPNINGAHLRTKGWELEIGWADKISDLRYFVRVNFSDNTNKVIDLADAIIPTPGINTFVQGYPTHAFFGYEYDGKIETAAELTAYNSSFSGESGIPNNLTLGDTRYKDLNGDSKLTSNPYTVDQNGTPTPTSGDLVYFGEGGQHYLYGINLGLSWKNFDFSSFFHGVLKWHIVSDLQPLPDWWRPAVESYFYHQTWAPDRTDVLWPRLSQNYPVLDYDYQYSNAPYKLFNNRYIRLKNIQVGYTFPRNFTNKLKIEKLRIYFSATDLWEHSSLPGNQDPETPFTQYRSPFPRQYSFGLNLTL